MPEIFRRQPGRRLRAELLWRRPGRAGWLVANTFFEPAAIPAVEGAGAVAKSGFAAAGLGAVEVTAPPEETLPGGSAPDAMGTWDWVFRPAVMPRPAPRIGDAVAVKAGFAASGRAAHTPPRVGSARAVLSGPSGLAAGRSGFERRALDQSLIMLLAA